MRNGTQVQTFLTGLILSGFNRREAMTDATPFGWLTIILLVIILLVLIFRRV